MKKNKLLFVMFFVLSILFGILFGAKLSFSIQKNIANNLITIISVVFAVLGIWIGVLVPKLLDKIESYESHSKVQKWEKIKDLFLPIFISLILFLVLILFFFIGEILITFSCFDNLRIWFRRAGSFILFLSMSYTIYLIIFSIKTGIQLLKDYFDTAKRSDNVDLICGEE